MNKDGLDKKVVRFFDEQAVDYDDQYQKPDGVRSFIFSERKKIVLDMIGRGYEKILDIGCGPGVYADALIGRCKTLYGVDVSKEMIDIAAKKAYPNAVFSVGSIEKIGFEDGFFDGLVCVGVLEYLEDPEKAVGEASRVMRSGGAAVFTAPNASSILNKLDYALRGVIRKLSAFVRLDIGKSFMSYDFVPSLMNSRRINTMLEKHGFRIEAARFHIFRLSILNRVSPRLSLFLSKKLNFVSGRWIAANYIVKARKI
jgi:ubiquinone/menaquinone biosynthesis C-methylase UbiE